MAITIGGPGNPGASIVSINNYSSTTTFKTVLSRANNSDSNGYVGAHAQLWRSTSAINNISLFASGTTLFNAGTTFDLYGIKSGAPKAMGGDVVVTDGNYWYHAFTSSGTFTPTVALTADVLVVAGGGGGSPAAGALTGAGGGAGGVAYQASRSAASGIGYTVTIGAGGGTSTGTVAGNSGSNSVFDTITAVGGGGSKVFAKNLASRRLEGHHPATFFFRDQTLYV
jgi:hypothetical protein